ncbi:MAG: hypothetical protein R3D85_16295 [Paracoccaceae bacterium]
MAKRMGPSNTLAKVLNDRWIFPQTATHARAKSERLEQMYALHVAQRARTFFETKQYRKTNFREITFGAMARDEYSGKRLNRWEYMTPAEDAALKVACKAAQERALAASETARAENKAALL